MFKPDHDWSNMLICEEVEDGKGKIDDYVCKMQMRVP